MTSLLLSKCSIKCTSMKRKYLISKSEMNSVCFIFSTVFFVSVLGQQLDPTWDSETGTVSLKASSDPSLCVTAISYNSERSKAFLQLIDCSQKFTGYEGDKRFDLDAISDGVYRFRTAIYPEGEQYPQNACFYASYVENSIALTDKCDRSNPWHYWTFPEVTTGKFQLKHKETGKCMRSPQISNGTTLIAADCNANDKNQIWNGEFQKQDWKWESDGRIYLKPVSDETLCMRTEQHDQRTSRVNLVSCEKEYEAYKGAKRIDLGKVPEGHHAMKTVHVPMGSAYGQHACMWAGVTGGSTNNSPVLTDNCNYNNSWQYWKFIEISNGRVQLMHKKTGKCIRATDDRRTVLTADCNKSDINQIWLREYL